MTRPIASPEPGFFKRRTSGVDPNTGERWHGSWVAAIIYRPCPIEFEPTTFQAVDRHYHLVAEENGKPADVDQVWVSGRRLDGDMREQMAEYLFLKADRAWARQHAPQSPEANPRQPIDFDTLSPPTF